MNKIYYKEIDKDLYIEKLDNGLTILLVPDKKEKMYYVDMLVKYGAKDIKYKDLDGNIIVDPFGIAHYLEHQKFSVKGMDAFDYFNKTGTNSNAGTGYDSTRYYINGMKSFKRNLNYFLNMIFTPYITDKTVSKELGIITEECNMYDDVFGKMDESMRNNLFFNNYAKEKISGTPETIKNINKDNLLHVYNNFYKPSNMLLIISGNINVSNTLNIIKNNKVLSSIKYSKIAERIMVDEPYYSKKEFSYINLDLVVPKLEYSFKIKYDNDNLFEYTEYLNIIMNMMFGRTSLFNEKVYKELLCTDYTYSIDYYDEYLIIDFLAESDKADMFKDLVDETIENFVLNLEDLNRFKKVVKADLIRKSDNIYNIYYELMRNFKKYNDFKLDRYDFIENIKLEDLINFKNTIDFSNNTFILGLPKDIKM